MARFPSGITGSLPGADVDDPHVRAAQLALTMDWKTVDVRWGITGRHVVGATVQRHRRTAVTEKS